MASIALCGALPILALALMFSSAIAEGTDAIDFRPFYRAGEAVLAGDDPYPAEDALLTASGGPYVYPPLPALVAVPTTAVPLELGGIALMAVLVLVALAIPLVLGVRDWRCYGIVLLWPPVLSAIQTANVTLWLALAAAVAWRYRERLVPVAAAIGVTLAVKFLFWPVLVWLAMTRRVACAALAALVGAVLVAASWAVIGFDGLREYPDLLRRLEDVVGGDAYTVTNIATDLGASHGVARGIWLALGAGLIAACALVARGGDDRSAFILALSASLALSPLVWLHYFALLIVVVAVARPRLGIVWFVPLAMFVATGHGRPSSLQAGITLTAAAVTVALALRETDERRRSWAANGVSGSTRLAS
jgi:alpha-1,2-mannosyltransferase